MSVHFLLKGKERSRNIAIGDIYRLSDSEAVEFFANIRWGSATLVTCPQCQLTHKAYYKATRQQWQCKGCKHTFSVTSGTPFHSHKKPLQDYLAALFLYSTAVTGKSALNLARELKISYTTAFSWLKKVRACLLATRDETPLSGLVHIDGCYFKTHSRKKNEKLDRLNQKTTRNKEKICVFVMRELYPEDEIKHPKARNIQYVGAKRTLSFVVKSESITELMPILQKYLSPEAKVYSDASACYLSLAKAFQIYHVNHSKEFQNADGVNTNLAESYFSRLRNLYHGHIRHCENKYFPHYANEIAFREDYRRTNTKGLFEKILAVMLRGEEW